MRLYCFLILLFYFLPVLVHAQLHDTLQRQKLIEFSIKGIEKTEVTHAEDPSKNTKLSFSEVNSLGFITNIKVFNKDGELVQIYEHDYLYDSILVESRMVHLTDPKRVLNSTKYEYSGFNKIKSMSFFYNDLLVTEVSFKYNENGKLLKQNQRWYGDKSIGSTSRKRKTTYEYNNDGSLAIVKSKGFLSGKDKKETILYKYDPANNMVETFKKRKGTGNDILRYRKALNDNNKIDFEEQYFDDNSTIHYGTKQLHIKEGEAIQTKYLYDIRGLIEQEIKSVNGLQTYEIIYKYI